MKKTLLSVLVLTMTMFQFANAQSVDKLWSYGIEGGWQQYNGPLGNGFDRTNSGMEAFGGLTTYRFLSSHLDMGIEATGGKMTYKNNGIQLLNENFYQVSAMFRFSFFTYDKVRLRPFILAGFGDTYLTGSSIAKDQRADDMSFPTVGAGLNFKLTENIVIKYQELYSLPVHSSNEGVGHDSYLQHTFGISYAPGHKKDADHDGVADSKDKCPNTPAGVQVDATGCPLDTDGDGIPDYLDACPDVKGVVAAKGCPDSDGDGVADKDDKCANTPAGVQVDATGCPLDRDGDGIPDYQDECPDVKGTTAFKGCPDSDGDGVADKDDKCANTPAGVQVDATGCPLDSDGDGLPDYLDACPDVKGTKENKGCPEVKTEVKELFKKALEGIEFETGSDVIEKHSFAILKEVVAVMKENTAYKLEMDGYTDNKGKAEANKILSEKRAYAVRKFLIDNGIEESRLKAAGFGGEKPIGDNNTEAGRRKNRRVEFIVTF